uniref:Uncharacterized protein n=1 Tax=Caenorhabditis japonica TaxID=281687 RepID=A0A8R1END1_CAEJA
MAHWFTIKLFFIRQKKVEKVAADRQSEPLRADPHRLPNTNNNHSLYTTSLDSFPSRGRFADPITHETVLRNSNE